MGVTVGTRCRSHLLVFTLRPLTRPWRLVGVRLPTDEGPLSLVDSGLPGCGREVPGSQEDPGGRRTGGGRSTVSSLRVATGGSPEIRFV